MSKEEILKQEFLKFIPQKSGDKRMTSEEFDKYSKTEKRVFDLFYNAMQEYADQQSQEDKKRIKELEDELNNTRDLYSQSENQRVKLESKIKELKEVADQMSAELEYLSEFNSVLTKYKELISK